MEIFMEQHPELFNGHSVENIAELIDKADNEDTAIAKRLHEATVIWGHPGMGKTHFFKNGGGNDVIDFDTVYKSRINKELNLPEGPEARKQWRREHREEYRQKLFDLFDEAIADAKRTGKKLLVSDMVILRERESDLDVITQMTEENFAQRSEQRNEPYDANRRLWKQDIDEAMTNVSDKSKIIETNAYFSDLYNIKFLQTSSGEVYGFVYQGEIYMDETKLDPQVPIHEYTHIWDEAVMQSNPRLWESGKRLLRDSKNEVLRNLWNEIAESDAYGKKWQAQGKTEEQIENLIAGEVHARLVGEKGAELLEQIEKAEGGKGLIARLKRWMKDIFRHIGKTFGTWTDEALNELSLNDFINMPLRDFLDGVNPANYLQNQNKTDNFGVNDEVQLFTDTMSIEHLNELAEDPAIPFDLSMEFGQYAAIADEYAVDMALDKGWNREALHKVEQITEQIENGTFVFKRFLEEESRVCREILGQSTWLLSGRSGSSSYTPKRVDQEGNGEAQQEKILIDWAKAKGLFVNDWTDSQGNPYDSLDDALSDEYVRRSESDGEESQIYYQTDNNGNILNVVKAKSLLRYDTLQEFLDSLVLHNSVFPGAPYTILGFGYDSDNNLRVVLQQPYVFSAENATLE